MNQIDLRGRRAIVTGAARGVGYAVVRRFLESGAIVSIWDINEDGLSAARRQLSRLGTVTAQAMDVTDYAQVESAAESTVASLGGIDLLVNCAGIAGTNTALTDYPLKVWQQVQRVNLDGTFHVCRAVVPYMRQGGYGRIVNMSSIAGKDGNPNASAYSVSKAGVIALTKCLGKELAHSDIRVNAIAPAVIETEMLADVTEEQIGYMLAKIPMGRMGTVEETAAMVAWMCSEECSFTTGAVFDLSGGRATY